MRTDNSTADGIMNGTVKQRRSKATDMRFYWLRDRVSQKMFNVHWAPDKVNLADYYTKRHPAKQVKQIRSIYINGPSSHPEVCKGVLSYWRNPEVQMQGKPSGTNTTGLLA